MQAQNARNIRCANASAHTVELFDLTGRVVNTVLNARNSVVLQRGDLSNGIYIVRITSVNGSSELVKVQFN